MHYCVVVEKNNSINSPVITVVPLTSVKPATDVEHLKPGCVYLGNELFTSLNSKIITTQKHLSSNIANAQERLEHLKQLHHLIILLKIFQNWILCKKILQICAGKVLFTQECKLKSTK